MLNKNKRDYINSISKFSYEMLVSLSEEIELDIEEGEIDINDYMEINEAITRRIKVLNKGGIKDDKK